MELPEPKIELPLFVLFSLLIVLAGFTPLPRAASTALNTYSQSDQHPPQDRAAAISRAAQRLPARRDLAELAAIHWLQAGDLAAAQRYFQQAGPEHLSPAGRLALGELHLAMGETEQAIAVWEALLQQDPGSVAAGQHLLTAYRQAGATAQAIALLQAWAALDPSPARQYQAGLELLSLDPQTALPYLLAAARLDPALQPQTLPLVSAVEAAQPGQSPAYTLTSAAQALARLGEWQAARLALEQAVQENPAFAEAWALLGEAVHQTGGDPLPYFRQALQLDPRSRSANLLYAAALQRQGDLAQAQVYFDQALALDPANPAILSAAGENLARQGSLELAFRSFQNAVELSPNLPVYQRYLAQFSLTHAYKVRGVALPAARQAVLLDPQDPANLDLLAQVYLQLNDRLSALRFLERALQIDPGYAPARFHRAWLAWYEGDLTTARTQAGLALSLAPPHSPTAQQAARLLEQLAP